MPGRNWPGIFGLGLGPGFLGRNLLLRRELHFRVPIGRIRRRAKLFSQTGHKFHSSVIPFHFAGGGSRTQLPYVRDFFVPATRVNRAARIFGETREFHGPRLSPRRAVPAAGRNLDDGPVGNSSATRDVASRVGVVFHGGQGSPGVLSRTRVARCPPKGTNGCGDTRVDGPYSRECFPSFSRPARWKSTPHRDSKHCPR